MYMYMHMFKSMYMYMHMCMYMCMYMHMCMSMYVTFSKSWLARDAGDAERVLVAAKRRVRRSKRHLHDLLKVSEMMTRKSQKYSLWVHVS